MPITYEVSHDGHIITATATSRVSSDEFVEFEVAHATDRRIHSPVAELLLIRSRALAQITIDDMHRVLERRAEIKEKPTPHRCGIVVQSGDEHSWNLSKFYEGMVMLHSPETVIVFGDEMIARTWLGIE